MRTRHKLIGKLKNVCVNTVEVWGEEEWDQSRFLRERLRQNDCRSVMMDSEVPGE